MFKRIHISNLRSIENAEVSAVPGINLLVGDNGSGKTSFLEAIYLLVMGRSFRHRETAPLLRLGAEPNGLQLYCEFVGTNEQTHRLGMQWQGNQWLVRLNGQNARRRSEILALMPVQWIGADPQSLVSGPPELRRAFLDSGMFHVEHQYLGCLQAYTRTLEQRNAALRSGSGAVSAWDPALIEYAECLDNCRKTYAQKLLEQVLCFVQAWDIDIAFSFGYRRGWSQDKSFAEALMDQQETDRRRQFTSVGPHRADLQMRTDAVRTDKRLSRGQMKMLASALYLAQSKIQKDTTGYEGLLLYDDLPAELDGRNRQLLLDSIQGLYRQSFITSLTLSDLGRTFEPDQMFHVEHGTVRANKGGRQKESH